jgi:hypothetical protein
MPQGLGLSPQERARITEIQDCLIELAVDKDDALAAGDHAQASYLQREIDALSRRLDGLRYGMRAAAD